jgi:sarcosine oxidase, subunit beta
LSDAETADAVVVGAGLLGAATTYELSKAGLHTVLLERGSPNRESSGATAGNIHVQAIHARRPGQVHPADPSVFLPLQIAASDIWDQLETELGADIEVRRGGSFMVAETEEQVAALRAKHNLEVQLGLMTELLAGDDARSEMPLLGPTVVAANYCAKDGYANPLLATPAFLRAANRFGARLYAFNPVTAISRIGLNYRISTANRVFEAPVLINAAGAWISEIADLAGIHLQMAPLAIQMHATERTEPLMSHVIQHVGQGLSVKQVNAGNFLIGGGWPAHGLNLNGRSPISIESMLGNIRQAHRVLPFLKGHRILRVWAGPLAATPDELPVIGEVPGASGFFVVGGTYGFTLAPLWAQVLSSLVRGCATNQDLSQVSVGRLVLEV